MTMTMATATMLTTRITTTPVHTRKTTLTHYLRYWSATVSLALSPASQSHLARVRLTAWLEPTRLGLVWLGRVWHSMVHIVAAQYTPWATGLDSLSSSFSVLLLHFLYTTTLLYFSSFFRNYSGASYQLRLSVRTWFCVLYMPYGSFSW